MKRLLVILLLIPSIAFGTFTEFYTQSGGSNLNGGSSTNNTAAYTSTSGNWTNSTRVFTPTDSSNPSSTVNVGDFASVYINGATVGVYIGRVKTVVNATNGAITTDSTLECGSAPANQTGTATIKVGGAWKGPNAASGFPITLSNFGNQKDSTGHMVRLNMKNDASYSLTAVITPATGGARYVNQGYSSSVGDGGKATWDGSTSTGAILAGTGPTNMVWADHIFTTSISSGTANLVTSSAFSAWVRCVFKGGRGCGFIQSAGSGTLIECEAYNNNLSNTSGDAGFIISACNVNRCVAHGNTGSNTAGFSALAGQVAIRNSISAGNGGAGIVFTGGNNGEIEIDNCEFYNNGSDGINGTSTNASQVWIENCNLVKNGGAGINNANALTSFGFIYNCGYGSGTQANTNADTLNQWTQTGTVTYASGVTPWVDPANGDFRINLPTANFAGRAAFTETQSYSSPNTVGYPDIGAAQSLTGPSGTFSKEVSAGYAH